MASPSIPAPTDLRLSAAIQQRTLRWIMLGIVALAAFLVAIVGQPPAQTVGPAGQHAGLIGVSHSGPTGPTG